MKFGPIPLDQAEGALLAHSLRLNSLNFKKGRRLTADDIAALKAAKVEEVVAARLEPGDVHEDEAAAAVAHAICGDGMKATAAFTGRCNLLADRRGLLIVDRARVDAINLLDESLTLATLPGFEVVEPRQMLATVKVIPFSVRREVLERCLSLAEEGGPLLRVAPFKRLRVGLVQTSLPGGKESLLDKTRQAIDERLQVLGCDGVKEVRCAHDTQSIGDAIARLAGEGVDMVLVSGASAIVDRRDVVPAGIERAGGHIVHFGMPVDPGNLLLLASIGERPVVGLPGCARSPKVNGFDWVLQRLLAGVPVTREDIMRLGSGGLLKEIPSRPLPRGEAVTEEGAPRAPRIAAIVLAAGQSRRMGKHNKLLADVEGEAMVRRAVRAARESQAETVIVVTGHESDAVRRALADFDGLKFVHNSRYGEGLSTSLQRGLATLPEEEDAAVVVLGDMPQVTASVIDRLIAAFNPVEGRAIVVPSWNGKRGNPVLFARRFFPEIQELAGDIGAKPILAAYPELVAEVEMTDDSVLRDIDTPEALAAISKK